MASGKPLLGIQTPQPRRVWYVNLEDPREEIERRVAGICLHFDITAADLGNRLFFDGREIEVILATQTRSGAVIAAPAVDALKAAVTADRFDVLILDPFVSTHRVSENDNMAIDAVAKTLGRIAGETNCAIELVHHVRKTGGAEITVEDGRGASSLVAAARSVRVLNRMSKDEAEQAGIGETRGFYFRADNGKPNMAPPSSKATWFRLENVDLGNAQGDDLQDQIGVVNSWKWPDAFAGVTLADLEAVKKQISGGRWRKDHRASNWIGKPIAEVMKLDTTNKPNRAKVNALLAGWLKSGVLVEVEGLDDNRQQRIFVEIARHADA